MSKNLLIGMHVACILVTSVATSGAATVQKRAVEKIATTVGKAYDNVAAVLWRNRQAVLWTVSIGFGQVPP